MGAPYIFVVHLAVDRDYGGSALKVLDSAGAGSRPYLSFNKNAPIWRTVDVQDFVCRPPYTSLQNKLR